MKSGFVAVGLSVAIVSTAWAQDAVQWRVQDGGNGHWYQRFMSSEVANCWSAARQWCLAQGADLASVTSSNEEEVVKAAFCDSASTSLGWFGFQGTNTWSDGEPVGYLNWYGGGPSGDGPYAMLNCAGWNDIGGPGGCWVGQATWLAEWSADCNADGIVDYGQCRDGSLADANLNNVPDCCEASVDCAGTSVGAGTCAIFSRGTDTVRISGVNTSLSGDYTLEWSGFQLNQPVVANPPATVNARIWSEQDSVTEDKALGLYPDRRPSGTVNSNCFVQATASAPLPVLSRTHVALVRLGGTMTLYVDGAPVQSAPQACMPLNGGNSSMSLGAFVYVGQPTTNYWRAAPVALDWVRVSGSARYTGSFAMPSEPIVADALTQMLVTFNGANPWQDLANPGATLVPGAGVSGGTAPQISTDCDGSGVPDQVELGSPGADGDGNGILDSCECLSNPALPVCCPADLNRDGVVSGPDLGAIIAFWGPNPAFSAADINRDGNVNGSDIAVLLAAWGSCFN
jgi:hypothetical protein